MSWQSTTDPECHTDRTGSPIESVIVPRRRDVGGFDVMRALPSAERRAVGPFVFFDQFGPLQLIQGRSLEVRPHPHIGLATVTYLFAGKIMHRDSLGTVQPIQPGEVNWMTAGHGIVHSERTSDAGNPPGAELFGIQTWVALPKSHEEIEPAFAHHARVELPEVEGNGFWSRIILGSCFGRSSPVATFADPVYVDCRLDAGSRLLLPAEIEERAVSIGLRGTSSGQATLRSRYPRRVHAPRRSCLDRRCRHTLHSHRWTQAGRPANCLVEFCFLFPGTDRSGESGLARGTLCAGARRQGVHSLAGVSESATTSVCCSSFPESPDCKRRSKKEATVVEKLLANYAPQAYAILRIVVGLLFLCHGLQKVFGLFGGTSVPFFSLLGVAGITEIIGGTLITLGFFTGTVAFILSGEMAVAYFMGHFPASFWPIQNQGEPAVLFCFIFLYMATQGSGIWSFDAAR